MSINFTANLLNKTTIPQRSSLFKYLDRDASIVELDVNNELDMKAIRKTEGEWLSKGGQYIHHFCRDAVEQHQYLDIEKEHFLALTTQNSGFDKLKSDNILGVMMFSETKNKANEITWLEVKPTTNRTRNKLREFKKVGSRLVEYVKNEYKSKDIYVHSSYDAVSFYRKNGFISKGKNPNEKYDMYFRGVNSLG